MFKLDKFDISNSLYWLEMPELGKKARLLLAFAGQANPQYYNAMLKVSGKRVRALAKSNDITAEDAEQAREEDRVLFPLFIFRDWENVEGEGEGLDENGFVPFSRENAKKLCNVLPAHLFDTVRNEAASPQRFYAEDEILPPDPVELAKN